MTNLFWVCKRCSWMCLFWGQALAINKWLMQHEWLSYTRALTVQTWLINRVFAEQRRLCRAHLQVLEDSFAAGELPNTPSVWGYFLDLRSLEAEGRYETVLMHLYERDRAVPADENDRDEISFFDELE